MFYKELELKDIISLTDKLETAEVFLLDKHIKVFHKHDNCLDVVYSKAGICETSDKTNRIKKNLFSVIWDLF